MQIQRNAIPDVARAVATVAAGGNPLAGAVAANLLQGILQDQNAQLKALEQIQIDTQALVRGPYNAGMVWLGEAATAHRTEKERREFIGKAKDKFIDASSQEPDDFRKALAQYEVGNCWAALGSNSDARIWFQRAQASAMSYLKGRINSLRNAEDNLVQRIRWQFGYLAGAAMAGTGSTRLFLGAPGSRRAKMLLGERQKSVETATVLSFLDALEELRKKAPALALEFDESPTKYSGLYGY